MATPLTVRILPPGAPWVVAGTEDQSGYTPEGLTASATEAGSDTISFNLRRDPRIPFPDLKPFSPIELEVSGAVVWSGYCWQTPAAGEYTIGVAGRGWQYHLDDDQDLRFFVHATPGDYVLQRSIATAALANYSADWPDPTSGAVPVLTGYAGVTVPLGTRTGVTLDLGYAGAKRISVDWDSSNNDANTVFFARAHDLPSEVASGAAISDAFTFALNTGATGTTSGTFATARRYVTLFINATNAHALPAAGIYLRIRGVRVYAQTAYESAGQSILKASDVLKAMLYLCPLLSADQSQIQSTTFNIPMLAPRQYQTARAYMASANAFHDWLLQVDVNRRVVYRPRPTAPLVETSPGAATFQDAALNNGEDVYNWVVTQATGPDGATLFSVRNATSALLVAQGRARTFVLNAGATLTQAAADALGDAWLASRTKTPAKGSLEVSAPGLRTITNGDPVHPSLLLLYPGELVRLNDRVNPDTGSWGRDGTIASVSYSHDGEKASLSIDSPRDRLDAFLAQLGVLETAAGL